jgi:hypothetical protein
MTGGGEVEIPKPKGPTTALCFYIKHKRELFRNEHPKDKINPEFNKLCSGEWKVILHFQKNEDIFMIFGQIKVRGTSLIFSK